MLIPNTTIEQWAVLRTVIEQESFAQAAIVLNRSQSSVSYAIARLQEGLGIRLMEVQGRRAVLTEAGLGLLTEAIPLINDLALLEQRGRAIGSGSEVRIRLLVDTLFPKSLLFNVLEEHSRIHPAIQIELEETVRKPPPDPLIAPFDLAIAPQGNSPHFGSRLREIELLAVARAGHSLFSRAAPLSSHTLARHRRVDIHPSTELTNNSDAENKNRVWQVSTIESAIAAVLQGLCYGWLPRDFIADHLAEGRLIPLDLAQGGRRQIPLDLFYADEERAGSGTKDLASLLFNATRAR